MFSPFEQFELSVYFPIYIDLFSNLYNYYLDPLPSKMKSALATLCLVAVISSASVEAKFRPFVSAADIFAEAGTVIGDIIIGGCKAIVALPNAATTTDTCLIACEDVQSYVTGTLFNKDSYTASTISPAQFSTYYNTFSVYGNAAINQCRQVEFMQLWDQRFSKISFSSGLAMNLAVQAATYN